MGEQADGAAGAHVGAAAGEALLAAIRAFEVPRARELVEGGADPDRRLPDGTTPLGLAVASGSPGLVGALLGKEPRLRLPAAERVRLLALARHWYGAGAEAELRRLSGARGPAEVVRVLDDADDVSEEPDVEQVTLGGRTVRAGYGAVLTKLEWAFRVLTRPGELVVRAARTDGRHVDFWESLSVLQERGSDRTWRAVLGHRSHPDRAHRFFVAEYLRVLGVVVAHSEARQEEADRVLLAWAAEESDPAVLATVLEALAMADEGSAAVVLPHAGHPDPRVRRAAAGCLLMWQWPPSAAALTAVDALARDEDPEVRAATAEAAGHTVRRLPGTRRTVLELLDDEVHAVRLAAAHALSWARAPHPSVTEALWALLEEDDQELRLEGAFGLSLLDDPRTPQARERVGRLDPRFHEDVRADGVWGWERRRRDRAACTTPER
ncbi:HEAT repeat domain-containing protein [Streptomyces sp. UH6]|uniref:HEAT repeat domain-containing protein n=1 Tax=Streptomyces sp. UH6 TaxID=2748379 RepID=UPI0015D4EE1D|nr:HEAT repeat domain-containing protein [Streptomyces sp. UH6]NYV75083.1 HEAT repeat domain-containing protein [Streptomyces sp. UH6]